MLVSTMETLTIESGEIEVAEYGAPGRPAWADVDWSLYRRSAIVEDRKINYVDLGDPSAPPVLLVHGLAGTWMNWLENLLPFSERFRVIALDLPGFGQSEMPRDGISVANYARIVQTLLAQLGITRIAVVGNSMGGAVSFQLAMDFPDLIESITAVSPVGISTRHPGLPAVEQSATALGGIMSFGYRQRKWLARRPGLRRVSLLSVATHPEKLRPELVFELISGAGKPGFATATDAIMSHDYVDRLGEVSCPVLLVWGRRDLLVPSRDAHRYAKRLPDARKLIVRDTGHLTMLERPAWFNHMAGDFISGSAA